MKRLTESLRKLGVLAANPVDSDHQHTLPGRIVSASTFVAIILCLALWITAFLLFQNSGIRETLSSALFTDLSCITFFGGLVVALGVGAMIGNFLRRALWKALLKRR